MSNMDTEEKTKRLEAMKEALENGKVKFACPNNELEEAFMSFASGRKSDFTVTRAEISSIWHSKDSTGFEISWGTKSAGFGNIVISKDSEGNVRIDDECMGPEFCVNVFRKLIEDAFAQDEKDKEQQEDSSSTTSENE